jgi:hypothetical protein
MTNEIAVISTPARNAARLPVLSQGERFERDLLDAAKLSESLNPNHAGCSYLEQAIPGARELVQSEGFRALSADAERALAPAPAAAIGKHLAALLGSFPSSRPGSPEIFSGALLEDVASLSPSVAAVEQACRTLRRELKFCPSICVTREAVKAAQTAVRNRVAAVRELSARVEAGEHALVARREQVEVARQERKAGIRYSILNGERVYRDTDNLGLIDEVEREMAAAGEVPPPVKPRTLVNDDEDIPF